MLAIIAVYLYFVTGRGQKWMKNQEAYDLTSVINVYNIVQIIANMYLGFGVSKI